MNGRCSGFSLLETVVALALVGVAVLVAAGSLQAHAALASRLVVQEQLVRCAEDVLEQVRGGALPLAPAAFDQPQVDGTGPRCRVVVGVEPGGVEGLHRLTVTARSGIAGESLSFELTTMVWRPAAWHP